MAQTFQNLYLRSSFELPTSSSLSTGEAESRLLLMIVEHMLQTVQQTMPCDHDHTLLLNQLWRYTRPLLDHNRGDPPLSACITQYGVHPSMSTVEPAA